MGCGTTFGDSLFSPGNSFKYCQTLLHELVAFHVYEIGAGQTMLGDENGLLISLNVGKEFGGLPFEGDDQFRAYGVTLQCHFGLRKGRLK